MHIIWRVREVLGAALRDVFDDGGEPPSQPRAGAVLPGQPFDERLAGLMTETQARLSGLHALLADALARQKRLQLAWQTALTEVAGLDNGVDAALRAGQDAAAREWLARVARRRERARELETLFNECTVMTSQVLKAIRDEEEQLADARSRFLALDERERAAGALEDLVRARRDYDRQRGALLGELATRQEAIARQEDALAARAELYAAAK